jgi:organic hydroperoxide reductase OsmC/OhrA
MQKNILLGRLKSFGGNSKMIVRDQQVPDIISAMLSAHKMYASEYDKISKDFYSGDGVQTAKKLFEFLKKNVRYKIESDKAQRIMSPSAILSLGKNDCKNYALFIMGVLDSLKRKGLINNKIYYRFASYRLLDEIPHHVFAVIQDNLGNEYFIDPVLSTFNERKTYYHKIDKEPVMPLYSVSGIGNQVGLFGSKKKKAAAAAAATAAPVAQGSQAAPVAKPKEKKKIVLKIALAPARGSFLLLVGLNFMGLATKLKTAFTNKADETQNWWKNLGGNPNELLRKTEQGAKKKRILGADVEFASEGQIGVVATGTAAAAATAAPILIKLAEFLSKLGIDVKEVAEVGKQVLAKQVKNVVEKKLEADAKVEQASQDEIDSIVNQAENFNADGSKKMNYLPIVIGGALVIYLISRKK